MSMNKKQLVKLISYMTMGDGGVYTSGNGDYSFIMNMKADNRDYVEWVQSVMSNVTSCKISDRKDYNTDGYTRQPQLRVETSRHPFFNSIRDRIYTDKYKGLDPHALKLMDAEALAILYMCDGGLHIDKPNPKKGLLNNSYNVYLHMKRLSYGDQLLLKSCLRDKLGLEWNIVRGGKYYSLRLRCKDVAKFMELVTPFVLPSFSYKLVRLAPEKDDDIVCSMQECIEAVGNTQPSAAAE